MKIKSKGKITLENWKITCEEQGLKDKYFWKQKGPYFPLEDQKMFFS